MQLPQAVDLLETELQMMDFWIPQEGPPEATISLSIVSEGSPVNHAHMHH